MALFQVLWPYLIEFIVPVDYTLAAGIVCRCVATIGAKKREEEAEDYDINFDELGKHLYMVRILIEYYTYMHL